MQSQVHAPVVLPHTLLRVPRPGLLADDPEVPLQDLWHRRPRQREHRQARGLTTRRSGCLPMSVL